MKSRIFLLLTAGLSIGLTQAAAHDAPMPIEQQPQAENQNRELKEFATGFIIGMFGESTAEKLGGSLAKTIVSTIVGGVKFTDPLYDLRFVEPLQFQPEIRDQINTATSLMHLVTWVKNTYDSAGILKGLVSIPIGVKLCGDCPIAEGLIPPMVRRGITFGSSLSLLKFYFFNEKQSNIEKIIGSAGPLGLLSLYGYVLYNGNNRNR